jgi:exosortase/archaeosortase family protein
MRARSGRWLGASALVLAGCALIAFAGAWAGVEATMSGHAIQAITGQTTFVAPGRNVLILYKDASVQSIFVLTGECSGVYLLAALLIAAAPMMLLRRLRPWRTSLATIAAAAVLILVNVGRLTAIGVTVSLWGTDPGLEIGHTYLGSFLTVVGGCAAGITLAGVLVIRRGTSAHTVA